MSVLSIFTAACCAKFLRVGGATNLSAKMAQILAAVFVRCHRDRVFEWLPLMASLPIICHNPNHPKVYRSSGTLKLGSTFETFIRLSLLQLAPCCCLMSFSQLLRLGIRFGQQASGCLLATGFSIHILTVKFLRDQLKFFIWPQK